MKSIKFILLLTSLFSFICCFAINSESWSNKKNNADTIVVSKIIPEDISIPLFREIEYFVIVENDTSGFSCTFSENKENGKINIRFNNKRSLPSLFYFDAECPYYKTTYRQQIYEFKMILKRAIEDFDFDKLQFLNLGLLVSTGIWL